MSLPLNHTISQNALLVDTGVLNKLLADIGFSKKFRHDIGEHCTDHPLYITSTALSFLEYVRINNINLSESYFFGKEEIKKCIADLNNIYKSFKENTDIEEFDLLVSKAEYFFNLFFESIKERYSKELKLSNCKLDASIAKFLDCSAEQREKTKVKNQLEREDEKKLDILDGQLGGMLVGKIKNIESKASDICDHLSIDFFFRANYKKGKLKPFNIDLIIFEAVKFLYANYHSETERRNMSQFRAMITLAHQVYDFHKKNYSETGQCNRETKEILRTIDLKIHKSKDLFDLEHIQSSCTGVFNEQRECLPTFVAVGVNDKRKYKNKELKDVRDRVRNFKIILRELNENELIKEEYGPIPFCDGYFLFVDSKTGEILEKLNVNSIDIPTLDPIISNIFKKFPFHHRIFEQFRQ